MRKPCTKGLMLALRRRLWHRACRGDVVYSAGVDQFRCVTCWDEKRGVGFWKYRSLEAMNDFEIGLRFEYDDEETLR